MSTVTAQPPAAAIPGRLPAPVQGAGGLPVATIDPFKLFNKYKWLLALSVFVGVVLGVGSHFFFMAFAPVYKPSVMFECNLTPNDTGQPVHNMIVPKDDMDRFMQTQVRYMVSPKVMDDVILDNRLITDAPKWSGRFVQGADPRTGRPLLNQKKARIELSKRASARALPETRLVELTMSYKDPQEAYAIVKLIKEKYLAFTESLGNRAYADQAAELEARIRSLGDELTNLQNQRARMMEQGRVDSVDERSNERKEYLAFVTKELVDVDMKIEAMQKQRDAYEEELKDPKGPTFSDSIRAEVERDPVIVELKRTIDSLVSRLEMLRARGVGEQHRDFKDTTGLIDGYRKRLETAREEQLRQRFYGDVDSIRKILDQFTAQKIDLDRKRETLTAEIRDLAGIQQRLQDIDKQIFSNISTRQGLVEKLNNIKALGVIDSKTRVNVVQAERMPDRASFPRLEFMLPLGVILVFGLTTGLLVLRELLDQRVKGPADVAMIPRTRVLGYVPDSGEDPGGGAIETAVRDRSRGILAESFRQVCSVVGKRLQASGHKSLLVVAGMPGSGASTLVSNLALASAGVGKKVLIVDANLRRPSAHRIFGLQESPGLVDVLSGSASLDSAVQRSADGRIALLSAGSKDRRAPELLAGEAMGALLAEAGAKFDLILIDVAPAMVAGDAIALANRCDASLLVAKAFCEKRGMVARIRNELQDSRGEFLGVVVNGVKAAVGGYLKGNIKAATEYHNAAA